MYAQDEAVPEDSLALSEENAAPYAVSEEADNGTHSPLEQILPLSPQAAALARYGDYPVSMATGVPQIEVPLYEIKLGGFTLPITISYHASGNKVNDIASSVGLGWVLNAGGIVTRSVLGIPDLKFNNEQDMNSTTDFTYFSSEYVAGLFNDIVGKITNDTDDLLDILENGMTANHDTESDRYTYNFAGKSGVFRYSFADHRFFTMDDTPIEIHAVGGEESRFVITDTDGLVYIFSAQEMTGAADDEDKCAVSAWYLTEVQTPQGNIVLEYEQLPTLRQPICYISESMTTGDFWQYKYDFNGDNWTCTHKTVHNRSKTGFTYQCQYLKRIKWDGHIINFEYDDTRDDVGVTRLVRMTVRANETDEEPCKTVEFDNDAYLGTGTLDKRMLLASVKLSDEGTYSFSYDNRPLPSYTIFAHTPSGEDGFSGCHTDYWGYYNGKTSDSYIPLSLVNSSDNLYYADRTPNSLFSTAGIIRSITYPTGGKTTFVFEQNHADSNTVMDVGGLRVKSIRNYDVNEGLLSGKDYYYGNGEATTDHPEYYMKYTSYHFDNESVDQVQWLSVYDNVVSEPIFPTFANTGATVMYGTVSEVSLTGEAKDCFYEVSALANDHVIIDDGTSPHFFQPSLIDKGYFDPPLLRVQYTDTDGHSVVKEENYTYQETDAVAVSTGCRIMSFSSSSMYSGQNSAAIRANQYNSPYIRHAETKAVTRRRLLLSKTTTDHLSGVSVTESYTYDDGLRSVLPRTVSTVNSDGKTETREYRRPYQYTDNVCTGMMAKNMRDPVIEEVRTYGGNVTHVSETRYKPLNGWYYPEYQYQKLGSGNRFERYHFLDYDTHGNPRTIVENGTDKTALVWGFNASWPVAKIAGKTYTELKATSTTSNKIGQIETAQNPTSMATLLADLRGLLPSDALMTTYNYKPLYGVSAITTENGYTTYYDYGTDGKLSAIRDADGPLQQFSYQYRNPYSGSGSSENYVRTRDMLSSSSGKYTYQYYDDLGRPVQTARDVTGKYTHDLMAYDGKGRVVREWLPAVGTTSPSFRSSISDISQSTHNDCHAYSVTTYDALDRPTFIQTAGDDWHSAGKGITKEYVSNAVNSVKRYKASMTANSLIKDGYYTENTLLGEKTTDEDGHVLTVFTDKLGRKVLERRGTGSDTYFVYDDLGQLRFVLSPQYQEAGHKDMFAYEYRYDTKGRMVKKILPQCEYTQYWYDKAGRMKFMQDGVLRSKGLYRFFLYDKFGRLCIQGTCTDCWRGDDMNTVTFSEGTGFQGTGYTQGQDGDVGGSLTLEIVNYYDSYGFRDRYTGYPLAQASSTNTMGLMTGQRRRASDGSIMLDAFYYDAKGRVTANQNIALGRLTTTTTSYKYWGDVYQTVQTTYPSISTGMTPSLIATTTNNYSSSTGLLSNTTLKLKAGTGSEMQKTIQTLAYDGLGRLTSNTRSGSAGSVTYDYNLRDWVTEINGTGFHEWLEYASTTKGTKCYNGNISVHKWQVPSESFNRGYKFTYDALDRLMEAVYGENDFSKHDNRYNEKVVEYSANGIMKRFQRRGLKSDNIYGKVDNLHITLDGNRPVSIIEDAGNQTVYGAMEFRSNSTASTQYGYDGNGSLIWDANKQIAHITYDNLNYPKEVQFTNGNRIQYVYSPDGQKLRTTHQTAIANIMVPLNQTKSLTSSQVSSTTRTDYLGNVIFTGTSSSSSATVYLNKYLFDGGYVSYVQNSTVPTFRYYTKDHLGNNRAVVNDNGTIEQTTHYYPFGGFFADASTNSGLQPYKYNGKELDRMHGLDLYDYGARQYDAVLPMFTQVDPMAEKYYHISPYAYCGNNPVRYVDMRGDSLSLSGTTENINSTLDVYNKGLGGYYKASVDGCGNVSLTVNQDMDLSKMTKQEMSVYEQLHHIISSPNSTKINVVNGSNDVIIGNAKTATVDIGDINAMQGLKNSSPVAALMHETNEQSFLQNPTFHPADAFRLYKAHGSAEGLERSYTGNVGVTNVLNLKGNSGYLEFYRNDVVIERIRIINGNVKFKK